ncbi:MAG: hypothetical protein ACT4OD_03220 [Candidatus Nitrosotenuis sp.]
MTSFENNFSEKYFDQHQSKIIFNRRLINIRIMTLIIGARCRDGTVIVGDKKVTGGAKPFTEKIRRLGGLDSIIFTAAGIESLFEEYLEEVSRVVLHEANLVQSQNEENPKKPALGYSTTDFKHACVNVLKKMKEVYSELEEHVAFENALQVLFAVPEIGINGQIYRLYGMDMLGCYPIPIEEGKIQQIGHKGIGDIFLKSLDGKDYSMRDVARIGSFIIKYVERERISDIIGVGDGDPQVWFIDDKKGPREIQGKELDQLLEGVDGEIVNIQKRVGTLSSFLRS